MILGAGLFQVPAIRKAVANGWWVVTVDNVPGNFGHRCSHYSIDCSTRDRAAVLRAARKLEVEGVCTFGSSVAVSTVSYVCERMQLNGPTEATASVLGNKRQFREFQRCNGLPHPEFVAGFDLEHLARSSTSLACPLFVKPADSSGSRGITRLDRSEHGTLQAALEKARRHSCSGEICVEEAVDGIEVGGDAMLVQGRLEYLAITRKHMQGLIVAGHSMPCYISSRDCSRVARELEVSCSLAGYQDGPLNFDVMVDRETVTIIEMSPRNGGNGIPAVVMGATGVDVEQATLRYAVNEPIPQFPPDDAARCCGSMVFGSAEPGTVRSIADYETLIKEFPGLLDLFIGADPGDRVEAWSHNGDTIGYAVFNYDCNLGYERVAGPMRRALCVDLV